MIFTKESPNDDVSQIFVETLEKKTSMISITCLNFPNSMIFESKEQEILEQSTHCHIYKDSLTPNDDKNYTVRDHSHFTGKFRGAAHNLCNLAYRKPKFLQVIFQNLAGYDAHLFIKNLGKTAGNIDCIPNNEEKYISFTKKVVVDTFTKREDEKEKRPKSSVISDSSTTSRLWLLD